MRATDPRRGYRYVGRRRRYAFTLRFVSRERSLNEQGLVRVLGEANCGDAVATIPKRGHLDLAFERMAASAEEAMLAVLRSLPAWRTGLRFLEAGPDLVGLSEVIAWAACSRQALRKRELSDKTFPLPAHQGDPTLFHLVELLEWIRRRRRQPIPRELMETATVAWELNQARQIRALPFGRLPKRTREYWRAGMP